MLLKKKVGDLVYVQNNKLFRRAKLTLEVHLLIRYKVNSGAICNFFDVHLKYNKLQNLSKIEYLAITYFVTFYAMPPREKYTLSASYIYNNSCASFDFGIVPLVFEIQFCAQHKTY